MRQKKINLTNRFFASVGFSIVAIFWCIVFATNAAGQTSNSNQVNTIPPQRSTVLVDFNTAGSTPHSPANGIYWNDAVMTHTGDHAVPLNGSADPMALVNTMNANSGWTLVISNLSGWNSSGASGWLYYNGPYPAALSDFPSNALNEFISIGNAGNPGPAISVAFSGLSASSTYNLLTYGACASGSSAVAGLQTETLTAGTSSSPATVSFNALNNSTTVVEWTNITPGADGQIVFTIDAPNGGALNFLELTEATASQRPPTAQITNRQSAGLNPTPVAESSSPGFTNGNFPTQLSATNGGTDTAIAGSPTTGDVNTNLATTPSASRTDLQQLAYQSGVSQQDIRKQADDIQVELTKLIRQLRVNGLDIAGAGSISNAASSLFQLSQGDMQKLINILQTASLSSTPSTNRDDLIAVFEGQKEVVDKLKELAMQLAAKQTRDELIAQIEDLMVRQAANIRQTKKLEQQPSDRLTDQQKAMHDIVSAEQTSIVREINTLSNALVAAAGSTNDVLSKPAKSVLAAMNTNSLGQSAAAEPKTNTGTSSDAATRQQTAVQNSLASMLQAATADEDALTRLDQAKANLDQVAVAQKDLNDAAQESGADAAAQAERESQIQDRTAVVKELLKPLNPSAANHVADAEHNMDHAAAALAGEKKSDAATNAQSEAAKSLADAGKLVDQQIASIQAFQNLPPADQLAALQKINEQIKKAQAEDMANPRPSQDNLQKVQPDVQAAVPAASGFVATAAEKLGQSQPDVNTANQNLAQAQHAIQQKMADVEAAQQFKALANQLKSAGEKAAAAAETLQQKSGNFSDAARELKEAQNLVNQVAKNPNVPSAAGQSLQKAADEFRNGSDQASKSNQTEAHAQTQQGIEDLQKAAKEIAQAMDQGGGGGGGGGGGEGQSAQADDSKPGQSQPPPSPSGQNQQAATAAAGGNGGEAGINHGQYAGTGPQGGAGFVVGELSHKDREAISQFEAEKTPPEYAPMVEQYYKNLADTSSAR